MKRILVIIMLMSIAGLTSCRKDPSDNTPFFFIYGNSISGEYVIFDHSINSAASAVEYRVRPSEIDDMNYDPIGTDRVLYYSTIDRRLMQSASSEEAFAYERILEREQTIESDFQDYCHRLGREGDAMARSMFVSAYVSGTPAIAANGELFGQPAGTDLSEWFDFKDTNIICVSGTDYTMSEQADIVDTYKAPAEYFLSDKMIPLQLDILVKRIPDEITLKELPVIRYGGDDVITVTISIPVTFERYWDWCKALYSNPQAEERFANGEIRIAIPFIRK